MSFNKNAESCMAKARKINKPEAARHCRTIGEVELLAWIGPEHDDRAAFWMRFSHLGDGAFDAGRAELYRRIEAQRQH